MYIKCFKYRVFINFLDIFFCEYTIACAYKIDIIVYEYVRASIKMSIIPIG